MVEYYVIISSKTIQNKIKILIMFRIKIPLFYLLTIVVGISLVTEQSTSIFSAFASKSSPYDSGYEHGCQTQVTDISINQKRGPLSIQRSSCLDIMRVSIVAEAEEATTFINRMSHRLNKYPKYPEYTT